MTLEKVIMLKLDSAYLCAEVTCRTVSNCSGGCPICHSEVINLGAAFQTLERRDSEDSNEDRP